MCVLVFKEGLEVCLCVCGSGFGLLTFAIVTLLKGVYCVRGLRQKKLKWKAPNLHIIHIMCQNIEGWFMLLSQSMSFWCFVVSKYDKDHDYECGIKLQWASSQTGFTCLSVSSFISENFAKIPTSTFRPMQEWKEHVSFCTNRQQ